MRLPWRALALRVSLSACVLAVTGCGAGVQAASRTSAGAAVALTSNSNAYEGTVEHVRDPSVIHVNGTWYLFITDNTAWTGSLPILCSQDTTSWRQCGSVFPQMPSWIRARLHGISNLWAPDISYFNGEYHVYYTASLANTESTLIGLATNTTLDPSDPNYHWVNRGVVLESYPGDEINVLDPNILTDSEGRIWLTYGSYWGGVAQREIDPATGMLKDASAAQINLAARPSVAHHPIEGSSQLYHNGYYYLFVSIDFCCNTNLATNNYKMAVGRSTDPHGPFVAQDGTPMLDGGSTVIVTGDGTEWMGVGGGTVYNDPASGNTDIVFHAQAMDQGGIASLWFKQIHWVNDWPVVN